MKMYLSVCVHAKLRKKSGERHTHFMSAFAELGLCPAIIRSVEDVYGWLLPTPVQQEAIPLILGGGDVLAAAETGSGKTGAFALPVLQICHEALHEQQLLASKPKGAAIAKARAAAAAAAAVSAHGISNDRDGLLNVSVDGLECSCSAGNAWAGGRAGVGVTGGRYYFEMTQLTDGIGRVGWSTLSAKLALGTDAFGFGFGGTGKKSHHGKFEDYGDGGYGRDDVIGCLLDRESNTISYFKNRQPLGEAFRIPNGLVKHALFPAVCLKGCGVKLDMNAAPPPAAGDSALPLSGMLASHRVSNSEGASASSFTMAADPPAADGRPPLALILEPARDLCEQVHECVVDFGRFFTEPRLSAALLVGGIDGNAQLKHLKQGVDIVSGTPGRVEDLVKSGKLSLAEVQFFVLDEADRLLDTGNLETILRLHAKLPKVGRTGGRLQTLLFSATLHTPEVRALAERITTHPTLVDLKGKEHVPETVHHVVVHVDPEADQSWASGPRDGLPRPTTDDVHKHDKVGGGVTTQEHWSEGVKRLKPLMLLRIIERLKMSQCLIFCRTNLDCDNLEAFLNAAGGGKAYRGKAEKGAENPFSCVVLAGQRSMDERRRNLAAFKEGDVRFMVCTDVAARGLDIKELPCVINMTLPDKEEDYVHRIGRVGRAEAMGLAVSLVSNKHKEKVWFYDRRKWEGKTLSTKLASQGGCCIWYDEPALFASVQRRLGSTIETLDGFLERVPGGVAALNNTLGQAKDGGHNAATADHLRELAPQISELAALEVKAQQSFILGIMPHLASSSAGLTPSKRPKDREAVERLEDNGGETAIDTSESPESKKGTSPSGARGSGKHRRHRGRGGAGGRGAGRGGEAK